MTEATFAPYLNGLTTEKIQRRHRERLAIVYIRQSTPQQVERHQESTRLQYGLVERAVHLGWARETVLVIDDDLGRSGATIEGRMGFQRLVAEVGLGNVGLVLGVEMSRLARSCRDWHQLLEICALFDTLIADVDGVYDPANYNDRLLLGLKGTMSEAELHILKARMHAGRCAKAQRGELGKLVPIGYVRRASGEVIFDPDEEAQARVRLIFELFERFHTAGKVMTYLVEHDMRMPVRVSGGLRKGELEWRRVNRVTLNNMLANPIYAGAYVYGRRPTDRRLQKPGRPSTGRRSVRPEEAEVFLPDRVPAYISWEQFQRNQEQIQSNSAKKRGPIRAGSALLSGLLICGRCGLRMTAHYNNNGHTARYSCCRMKLDYADPFCQSLTAAPLDALIAEQVLQAIEPGALEASLAVAADMEAERARLDQHWRQRLERARYQAERAHRQYEVVEPENRLVARTLERAWEEALAEEARLASEYDRFQKQKLTAPTAAELAAIRELAEDLPALWSAETTTQEERQTIVRLVLERILVEVLNNSEQVRVECHWFGGSRTVHQLQRPVARLDSLSTYSALLDRAAQLYLAGHGSKEIAAVLNAEGWRPPKRRDTFNAPMAQKLLVKAGVFVPQQRRKPQVQKLPDEWTISELAEKIGMPQPTLYNWIQQKRLRSRSAGKHRVILVRADKAMIDALKTVRTTPAPWRRRPPVVDPA